MLHYQIPISVSFLARGHSMYCVRWSNEAATVHADITADHRDVPANLFTSLSKWDVANPRTTSPTSTICFFLNLSIFNQFYCTSVNFDRRASVHFRTHSAAVLPIFWPGVLLCFARMIHSKPAVRKAFPSKCVCVCVCASVCLRALACSGQFQH